MRHNESNGLAQPTPREQQVLELICEGLSTKQIARQLGISFKTVICHRMHLMDKAQVHDSIRLFRWALQNGFVSLERKMPPASEVDPAQYELSSVKARGQ